MHSPTLAVKLMEGSITGIAIRATVEGILADWEIPLHKIKSIVTDNG